jgi:hypothetical protein
MTVSVDASYKPPWIEDAAELMMTRSAAAAWRFTFSDDDEGESRRS